MFRATLIAFGVATWAALWPAHAVAGFVVGPGNVAAAASDGAFDIIAVDLNNPLTFAPGSYIASIFNYQFDNFGFVTTGTITPILLTGGGTNFTPIAVGSTITYNGPTAFVAAGFGGLNAFTLTTSTTVYGGLYWEATSPDGSELRMPVGYVGPGSSFVVYGGGFGPGANPPVVGTKISGSAEGFFSRNYDFSIESELVAAVPAPSSLLLALAGIGGLCGSGWFRRRRLDANTFASSGRR